MRRRGELIVASPLRDVFPQTRQAGAVSGASLLLVLYIAPNVVTDNAGLRREDRWLKSKLTSLITRSAWLTGTSLGSWTCGRFGS